MQKKSWVSNCGHLAFMYTTSGDNLQRWLWCFYMHVCQKSCQFEPCDFPNCSQHFWSQKLHDPWTAWKCYVANSFTQHESGWILCSWLCQPLLFHRAMSIQGVVIRFKFLHPIRHCANAVDSFDWPRRDDVDNVHINLCVLWACPVSGQYSFHSFGAWAC